jgi:hypothetical protein
MYSIFEFEIKKQPEITILLCVKWEIDTLAAGPTNLGYQNYYSIFALPKKKYTAFS